MSFMTEYDPENIFAKIIRGEMPAIKTYEDGIALAFMDIFPQSRGHTLVIPKHTGATNLLDAEPAVLSSLIERVQIVARGVAKALAPDGIRIAQFNGSAAGQTVFHLHFHIIPAYIGESMRAHAGEKADFAELEDLAKAIRAALS